MCGIVGYMGYEEAAPILLDGLGKLEYRGYDSAGLAVRNSKTGKLEIIKAKGRLKILSEKTDGGSAIPGNSGIGHTRWATHGEPSEANAHPHCSDDHEVIIVHNGIIENYMELKEKLQKAGYTFYSRTDTEVACKLIHYYYKKTAGDYLEAILRAMLRMRGSYALGVLFASCPDQLFAVRKDSPLILGHNEKGSFIASDVPAVLKYTRQIYYMGNMEVAVLQRDQIHFYNIDKEELTKEAVEIHWDAQAAEKNGYEHFMIKEIHEQPKAVEDTLHAYVRKGEITFAESGLSQEQLASVERIYMVACGSAYHVGVTGKYVIEKLAHVPVEVDLASEFRYRDPKLVNNALVIVISQSGETADSLAALRLARTKGVQTLGIVNVLGSAIAREADACIYTYAGPEISVASTKAYATQLVAIYLFAVFAAEVLGRTSPEELYTIKSELLNIPELIKQTISTEAEIAALSKKIYKETDMYYLGRGLDYAVAMEGSLKLKEISYIHSETYAGGELKHGPIALIEDKTVVLAISCDKDLCGKMESNIKEVITRGAFVVLLANDATKPMHAEFSEVITVPETLPLLTPLSAVAALQLLAYYVAKNLGYDIDKPRNLAKSVTVE